MVGRRFPFLLGSPIFRCKLLVSGRIPLEKKWVQTGGFHLKARSFELPHRCCPRALCRRKTCQKKTSKALGIFVTCQCPSLVKFQVVSCLGPVSRPQDLDSTCQDQTQTVRAAGVEGRKYNQEIHLNLCAYAMLHTYPCAAWHTTIS